MRTEAAMLREYKRRRPKKLAERKDPLAITQTPCCGRCRFWTAPRDAEQDPFGECGRVEVVERRSGSLESGTAVTREELRRSGVPVETVPMRVRSWAPACSQYVAHPAIPADLRSRDPNATTPKPISPTQPRLIAEPNDEYEVA
jgi:hypothetical protein